MTRKYSQFITHNKEGKRHSFNDPSVFITHNKEGKRHSFNDPVIVNKDGTKWYKNGKF